MLLTGERIAFRSTADDTLDQRIDRRLVGQFRFFSLGLAAQRRAAAKASGVKLGGGATKSSSLWTDELMV